MENLNKIIEFIDKKESLTQKEIKDFEEKILQDKEFAEQVAFVLASRKKIVENNIVDTERQERFNKVRQEMEVKPFKINRTLFFLGTSMAACLVLFGCYLWFGNDTISRPKSTPVLMKDSTKNHKDSVKKDSLLKIKLKK